MNIVHDRADTILLGLSLANAPRARVHSIAMLALWPAPQAGHEVLP